MGVTRERNCAVLVIFLFLDGLQHFFMYLLLVSLGGVPDGGEAVWNSWSSESGGFLYILRLIVFTILHRFKISPILYHFSFGYETVFFP